MWLGATQENIRKLHLLQNIKKVCHISPSLQEVSWLPINEMLQLTVTMVCKCLPGLAPNYLETKLVKSSSIHCYTRQKNSIKIIFKRTSIALKSFFDHSISLWHNLCDGTRSTSNVTSFKRFVRLELWAFL